MDHKKRIRGSGMMNIEISRIKYLAIFLLWILWTFGFMILNMISYNLINELIEITLILFGAIFVFNFTIKKEMIE